MFAPDLEKVRIYLRAGATDMRKQINGLAVLVEQELELDPFAEAVFLFCNRERRTLKALYWDANGFAMWSKRLEKHRYPWPEAVSRCSPLMPSNSGCSCEGSTSLAHMSDSTTDKSAKCARITGPFVAVLLCFSHYG